MATLLGPLTTTFTPPSDCNWFSVQTDAYENSSTGKYWPYFPSAGRCYPSGFPTGPVAPYGDPYAKYYYSPGICPSGWTAIQSQVQVQDETTVRCCPPGFSDVSQTTDLYKGEPQAATETFDRCYFTLTVPTTATAVVRVDYQTGPSAGSPSTIATSTNYVIQPLSFFVDGIHVRYRAGDFPSPGLQGSEATSRVGIPLAVLVLAITVFGVLYRRRRRSNVIAGTSNDDDLHYDYESKPELPSSSHGEFHGEVYKGKPELETISTQIVPVVELPETQHSNLPPELHSEDSGPVLDAPLITLPELDGDAKSRNPAELATSTVGQGADTSSIPPAASSFEDEQFQRAGPLPLPSELFPSIKDQEEDLDEEELRYQEQGLKERRELLAEKERLAIEEDRLRRIRAKKG